MMRIVFVMALCLAFSTISSAQVVKGTAVWYFDSIPNIAANAAYRGTELAYSIGLEKMYRWDRQDSTWVELSVNVYELDAVADTSTITMPQEGDIAITEAILLVRASSAWLQFAGGDDWGDQVVHKDSTLRGDGTAGDPLRVNRDSFLTAAIIEDSLAAVREDILPTDLSFSGASSPVTLQSSTGTDVSFLAGTGMGFSQTGNQLTLNNTGVTGSTAATTYLPKWSSSTVLTGDSRYRFNDAYPALEVYGWYNSNTTMIRLASGGANPLIQSTTANNGLLMQLGGNGSLYVQNTGGTDRFGINGGSSTAYFPISLLVGGSTNYPARLTTRGSGTTSVTYSFIAENSSGTDHFQVRDDGGVFVPVRSGTATALGGWTSDHRATNTSVSSRLSLSGGTLDINADSIPTFATLPANVNLYNSNGSLTGNRTLTQTGYTLDFFKEDNNIPAYSFYSNLYERIGQDTFLIPTSTSEFPIIGKSWSIDGFYDDSPDQIFKGKMFYGLDPDWNFDLIQGAQLNSELSGSRMTYFYSPSYHDLYFADYTTLTTRVRVRMSRQEGIEVEQRGGGTQYFEGKTTSSGASVILNTSGIEITGSVLPASYNSYVYARPHYASTGTELAAWAGTPGDSLSQRALTKLERENLRISNDTLIASTVKYAATATKTVSNTTTETTLNSTTAVGSNQIGPFKVGASYKVEAWGYYTADTTNNEIEIRLENNGFLLCTTGARSLTTTEGGEFHVEAIFTIQKVDGSPDGRIFAQGKVELMHSDTDSNTLRMLRSTTNNIDTENVSNTIDLTAKWTTASTANSITCTNFVIIPLTY